MNLVTLAGCPVWARDFLAALFSLLYHLLLEMRGPKRQVPHPRTEQIWVSDHTLSMLFLAVLSVQPFTCYHASTCPPLPCQQVSDHTALLIMLTAPEVVWFLDFNSLILRRPM